MRKTLKTLLFIVGILSAYFGFTGGDEWYNFVLCAIGVFCTVAAIRL